jgi:hypothetical protein
MSQAELIVMNDHCLAMDAQKNAISTDAATVKDAAIIGLDALEKSNVLFPVMEAV